jgi:two-component system, OmpR family, response regulator
MNRHKVKIFLVDDDALFLRSLQIEFEQQVEYTIETFATGEACMQKIENGCDMVILDYHLDGIDKHAMNGIETLDKIKGYDSGIPVIMLSSQDKIEVAVNCMHHNALDYIVKSETAFFRLEKVIKTMIEHKKTEDQLNWYMNHM